MDNNINSKSEDLPKEKKKSPLGKSFQSTTTADDSFAGPFNENGELPSLTTVSSNRNTLPLLDREHTSRSHRRKGHDPLEDRGNIKTWQIKIFLN
ncbi:MAG TPA: hypothetical protein VFI06_16935 [Chitinophagaceae bacterium]|nr:hypothetical protein [Chitinophagaceae bacterium]